MRPSRLKQNLAAGGAQSGSRTRLKWGAALCYLAVTGLAIPSLCGLVYVFFIPVHDTGLGMAKIGYFYCSMGGLVAAAVVAGITWFLFRPHGKSSTA